MLPTGCISRRGGSSRCSMFFFFQAEDGIRDYKVTGVQTCALPIWWILTVRTFGPTAGARASLEQVAISARVMLARVDTTRLNPEPRAAMRQHQIGRASCRERV